MLVLEVGIVIVICLLSVNVLLIFNFGINNVFV